MTTLETIATGLPALEPEGGEGSRVEGDEVPPKGEAVTTKHVGLVLAAFAAFQVIVGVGANWFFYTRSDGRVLEAKFDSMQRDGSRMADSLNTLAGTVNAILIQQAKQGELSIALSQAIERLERKDK